MNNEIYKMEFDEKRDIVYSHMYKDKNNEGPVQSDSNPEIENEQEMIKVYEMVDVIPLSRPKKNIARDFSDGVLIAEIVKYFTPKNVELHNYSTTNNLKMKRENWNTLNRKVFKKLNFQLSSQDIEAVINFKPGYIESILLKLFNTFVEIGIDVDKILQASTNLIQQQSEYSIQSKPVKSTKLQQVVEDDYKKQLLEKEKIIEELKVALQEAEKNLQISEDNKKILYQQLDSLKKKIKEIGLY